MARFSRRTFLKRGRDDAASASMVSYVVAASVFILSTSVLVNFVVEPPGNPGKGLEEQDLKTKASTALSVLMGTPGYPSTWEEADPDNVTRLGLVREGSSARLDPTKFSTVARGRFVSPSSSNGFVDYSEAKAALGLDGYDFHLRGRPLLPVDDEGYYGTKGMTTYRVAYIGDWNGVLASDASAVERGALDLLDIGFVNSTRLSLTGLGDVFRDDKTELKSNLVPLLGTSVSQTAVTAGSGNAYDFHRINATDFDHVVLSSLLPASEKSLALSQANSKGEYELGYTKGREIRALLGNLNLSDQLSATLAWKEHVDTDRDAGDYGYLEVSPDGGATWHAVTNDASSRSQDTATSPQPAGVWRDRVATLGVANCAACMDNEQVLLALHWVADGDNTRGDGWILDQLTVTAAGTTLVTKDFETPEYQLLVIGSNVDQNALTTSEVKYAIRDYVETYGGRILVLGGDASTQWLQPIFHVGMRYGSSGVSNPDPTHPLLTTPNELDWQTYNNSNQAWDFGGGSDEHLFDMVVGTGSSQHVLSVSKTGSFGPTEGGVILTTYLPYKMSSGERLGFLANAITYGHYNHLYLEMGPEVPSDVPVGSVSRTAIMEKTRDADADFTEMGFVLYLWRGNATSSAAATATPSNPRSFSATPASTTVTLQWGPPYHVGASAHMGYNVYRATSPGGVATRIANVSTSVLTYVDGSLSNGVTYYYNVTAWNWHGESASTAILSATPATVPGQPQSLTATGGASQILLTWTDPLTTGGAAITGYQIHRSASNGFAVSSATLLAETGANNSFLDAAPPGAAKAYYRVIAVNGMGASAASSQVAGEPLSVPSAPPNVVATPGLDSITLTWSPPSSLGAITRYEVYAGNTADSTSFLASVGNTTTTYTETGLASGATRYYRVLAVNDAGTGGLSTAAGATTLRLSTAPTTVLATGAADGIVLTWAPPTDPGSAVPTKYRIWRGTTADALVQLADTVSGSNTSFIDAGLADATTRYYQVAAVTSVGEGVRSSTVSATTHDVASAPTLTLTPGIERMTLAWTVPVSTGGSAITGYKIYRGETAGGETLVYTLSVADGTVAQDPLLLPNKTYWYYVRAITAAGDGSPSAEKSATTLGQPGIGI